MVVDVIATEIGEDRRIEMHTVDTFLFQRVRRYFERRMARAFGCKSGEPAVQVDACRRSHVVGIGELFDTTAQRADVSAFFSHRLQALRDQVGNGSLAIGSGYAEHFDAFRRRVEKPVCYRADVHRKAGYGDHGYARGTRIGGSRVPDDRSNSGFDCMVEVINSVRVSPLQGNEQVAFAKLPAVRCNASDRNRRRVGKPLEQTVQRDVRTENLGRHVH